MKQYRITTDNLNQDSNEDCHLDPSDPIHELKSIQYLAGLGHPARLQEYKGQQGSNISTTGNTKGELMKQNNIQPGTPEWFKLWFSLPYMTGEKPVGDDKWSR
jgi:hypothetical protein